MRYLTIIVSLLLFSSTVITGQSRAFAPGKFYLGVNAGMNATAIVYQNNYGQTELDYKVPIGLSVGATASFWATSKSHFIIEAIYQQMGQIHDDKIKRQNYYKNINLNYLSIPILYKLILNKASIGYSAASTSWDPKWYIEAGVQPSFLISAHNRYEIDGQQTDFITFITRGGNPNDAEIEALGAPEDDSDLYLDMDVALIGAAGFHQSMTASAVGFIELRGSIGLLDINAEEWRLPGASGTYNWSRNLSFGVHAGIIFKLF